MVWIISHDCMENWVQLVSSKTIQCFSPSRVFIGDRKRNRWHIGLHNAYTEGNSEKMCMVSIICIQVCLTLHKHYKVVFHSVRLKQLPV